MKIGVQWLYVEISRPWKNVPGTSPKHSVNLIDFVWGGINCLLNVLNQFNTQFPFARCPIRQEAAGASGTAAAASAASSGRTDSAGSTSLSSALGGCEAAGRCMQAAGLHKAGAAAGRRIASDGCFRFLPFWTTTCRGSGSSGR